MFSVNNTVNFQKRSTTPTHIGTLRFDVFLYIIIGIFDLLCCSFWIWGFFKAVRAPRKYFQTRESEAQPKKVTPIFREKQTAAPARVSQIMRNEVVRLRAVPKYQAGGSIGRALATKPNLPIPALGKPAKLEQDETGIDARDIEAWGGVVAEKKKLDLTISNLERITQGNTSNPKLQAAVQKLMEVESSILTTYEKFKGAREDFTAVEWQMIEQIKQYSA